MKLKQGKEVTKTLKQGSKDSKMLSTLLTREKATVLDRDCYCWDLQDTDKFWMWDTACNNHEYSL